MAESNVKVDVEVKVHHLEPWYTKAWLLWLLSFCIVEGIALFNKKKGDTLSEHVWIWFAVEVNPRDEVQKVKAARARKFILLAFMSWLTVHFLTAGQF